MEVYVISGNSREHEASATWIHSIYYSLPKAKSKLKQLKEIIDTLPNQGNARTGMTDINQLSISREKYSKILKKVDKNVEYLDFGVGYSIKKYHVEE